MSIQDISTQDTAIQYPAIEDIGTQVLPVQRSRSKTRTHRLTLVIVLLAIFGFLGSLMLTVSATWVDNNGNLGATSTDFKGPCKKSAPIIGIGGLEPGETALYRVY
jgi:hypothetical protein